MTSSTASSRSLLLVNALLASLLLLSLLPPTFCVRNDYDVVVPRVSSRRGPRQQRRAQTSSDNEDYLPKTNAVERTWLFGAGDLSEITNASASTSASTSAGGVDDNDGDSSSFSATPVIIETPALLEGEYVADVAVGGLHSVILTNEGRILTAGGGGGGGGGEGRGLGRDYATTADSGNNNNATTTMGFAPVTEVYYRAIPADDADADGATGGVASTAQRTASVPPRFVKVAASRYYTFAVDDEGGVWSTGNNAYAQLCLNDTTSRDRFHRVDFSAVIDDDADVEIVDIALGERHSLMLARDGRVYGCGWNSYGQLGITGTRGGANNVASPTEISVVGEASTDDVVAGVAAGRGSSYFLTESGRVYAAGTNYKGQLCLGHREDRTLPTELGHVETFLHAGGDDFSLMDEGVKVASIAAGSSSLYLLLSNGSLLACGENTHGQLGVGDPSLDDALAPAPVLANSDASSDVVVAVYSGPVSYGAHFVTEAGAVYVVGFDGTGARENWAAPGVLACPDGSAASGRGSGGRVTSVSSGDDLTLYLAAEEAAFGCADGEADATTGVPSAGPSSSGRPSHAIGPSSAPSVSSAPTASPSPTAVATEGSTTDDTYLPTYSPTASHAPSEFDEDRRQAPLVVPEINEARRGYSLYGYKASYFWGTCLVVMWQWL